MACRFHIGGQPAREPVANVEVRIFQLALQRLCLCIEHPDPAIRLCQTYAALTEALIEITSYGVTVDGKGRGIVKRLARKFGLNMRRSEEHTSELQSLMRISYAVFCLKKKKHHNLNHIPK